LKESAKIAAKDQNWPFMVNCWKALLNPCANAVAVSAKQLGYFLNRVVTMNFDEPIIYVARYHAFVLEVVPAQR
jgi:hypothetical protein